MRIQNFSNHNVTFNRFPTGVPQASPQSADAATSLNATALTVANWRAEVSFPTIIGVYSNGAWFLEGTIRMETVSEMVVRQIFV